MTDPGLCLSVLNRNTTPNVRWSPDVAVSLPKVCGHQAAALGQDLKYVPVSYLHRVEDLINKCARYRFVE